jgi:SulP family sulfate permease
MEGGTAVTNEVDAAAAQPPAGRWLLPFGLIYSAQELRRDLLAALTVAAISLPQAMAYALLAGVDPRYGLYSAIVVTAVAALFGSSSHLINGPTSAISLVVFAALAVFDPDQRVEAAEGMFLLGVMIGTIQIAIGAFRLGDLTRYISESVILGFMSAAAVLLAIGQLGTALGLSERGTGTQHLMHRLWMSLRDGPVNLRALSITAATLLLATMARYCVNRFRLPRMDMLAVLIVVATAVYFAGWTVPTASGSLAVAVAGRVPAALPTWHIPIVQLSWLAKFAPDALAIAFLGLLEALAIAKSIALHTGQSLDFNRQCLAEGLANLAGGFFRCLPGSGSLSRSAINYQSGGATRAVGIFTAGFVGVAVLAFAPLARFVPKATLAALLLLTAARLIEPQRLLYTMRASPQDAAVLLITIVTALALGLDVAILVGVALSMLLSISRASRLKCVELLVDRDGVVRERVGGGPRGGLPPAEHPPGSPSLDDTTPAGEFLLYDLEGELFFGAAPFLGRSLDTIMRRIENEKLSHVMLRLKRVRHPDAACLERLEHFLKACARLDVTVLLAGVQPDLLAAFRRLGFFTWYPEERVYAQGQDEDSATLAAIRHIYRESVQANSGTDAQRRLYYLL